MSEVEEISIKIKRTNNNNLIEVKISKSATVLELKEVIQEKSGIEANRQSLVYKGKILADDRTLSEYQVENDHTLILVEKVVNSQSTHSSNTGSNTSTSRPFTMQAGLGTPGIINTDILRHPVGGNMDLNTAMNLMSNPQVQQAMNEMLNNPQVLNAILENPSIKPMLDSNPLMRSMLSNPQFLQTLMDPTFLQNMSNMMNTMNSSNSGFSFPNTNTPNTSSQNTQNTNTTTDSANQSNTSSNNTTSSMPTNPFSQGSFPFPMFNPGFGFPFMNMNSMNNFTNPLVNNQNIDPKEKYKEQNQKLKEMGFINDDLNIEVLTKTGGNIDAAVERLLNML